MSCGFPCSRPALKRSRNSLSCGQNCVIAVVLMAGQFFEGEPVGEGVLYKLSDATGELNYLR